MLEEEKIKRAFKVISYYLNALSQLLFPERTDKDILRRGWVEI